MDHDQRLDELRSACNRRVNSLTNSFDDIVEGTSDVATDDEHDPEGHTVAWERQQLAALINEAQTTIADIDAAKQRLDHGQYGTCVTCGLSITEDRLLALPATPTCVDCAE